MTKAFAAIGGFGLIVLLSAAIFGQLAPREPSYIERVEDQVKAESLYLGPIPGFVTPGATFRE